MGSALNIHQSLDKSFFTWAYPFSFMMLNYHNKFVGFGISLELLTFLNLNSQDLSVVLLT